MFPNGKKVVQKGAKVLDCSDQDSNLDIYNCVNVVHLGYDCLVGADCQDLCMQNGTRAGVTIVPESVLKTSFPHFKCEPSHVSL